MFIDNRGQSKRKDKKAIIWHPESCDP
jgi:hypothetical protein